MASRIYTIILGSGTITMIMTKTGTNIYEITTIRMFLYIGAARKK